jgi:hypothetical protein
MDAKRFTKLHVHATEASDTGTKVLLYVDQSAVRVEDVRNHVHKNMVLSETAEGKAPLEDIYFQYQGRKLQNDFPLISYHLEPDSMLYLRIPGNVYGGHATKFPFHSEPKPEPIAMTLTEMKNELRGLGGYKRNLTQEQLQEAIAYGRQKATRPLRLTEASKEASTTRDLHVRRKLAEVKRTHGKGKGGGIETLDITVYGDDNGKLDQISGKKLVLDVFHEGKKLAKWSISPAPISKRKRKVILQTSHPHRVLL